MELTSVGCHGCKQSLQHASDSVLVGFGGRFFHNSCFACSSCRMLVDTEDRILLLGDGKPVCGNCAYRCCSCYRTLAGEAITTSEVYVPEIMPDWLPSSAFVLFANRVRSIRCTGCAVPPIASLPSELLLRIILFSLPDPLPNRPFDARSCQLRQYALVNKSWRTVAQAELFLNPVIAFYGQGKRFMSSLDSKPSLGTVTTKLVLGDWRTDTASAAHASRFQLGKLLNLLPELRNLEVYNLNEIAVSDLVVAQGLLSFTSHSSSFLTSPLSEPPRLPLLRSFYRKGCGYDSQSLASLLTPTGLPALRVLSVEQGRADSPISVRSCYNSLLPQLEYLCVDPAHWFDLITDQSKATSLILLSLSGPFSGVLDISLPSPLPFLHIQDPISIVSTTTRLAESLNTALENRSLDKDSVIFIQTSDLLDTPHVFPIVEKEASKLGLKVEKSCSLRFEDMVALVREKRRWS